MEQIRMSKDALLQILQDNRAKHREVFLEAQAGYRKMAIEELERTLEDARRGKTIRRTLTLIAPQDMTKQYDRAVGMLEAHTEGTILVSSMEYSNYVLDEWNWSSSWANNTSSYASSPVAAAYLASKMGGQEV